ncbi:hypothetical protein ACT7C6_30395, partial [Bacillus paranthracis]
LTCIIILPFVKELKHFDNNSEKLYLQNSENGKWGDENKDAMIQLLRDRVKELELENKQLKDENRKLQGELYEQI